MLDKKQLYQKIVKLTLPIMLSNLLNSVITAADTLMTNFVGQAALSATSLASQYNSVAFMFFFGITCGSQLLGSQYWGKKDLKAVQKIQKIAMRFALLFGALFFIVYLTIPELLMKFFTSEPELIEMGSVYLRILAPGAFCWAISTIYMASLETIERVKISTAVRVITVIYDTALTAVFIFGLFGAPKLGIVGVAISTSTSHILQLIMCIIVSAKSKDIKLDLKSVFIRDPDDKVLTSDFIKRVVPATANDISWGLGFSMYSVIFGHLGSDIVAANSVISMIRSLAQVACFSLSGSTLLIIGQYLGRGEIEEAKEAGKHLLLLTAAAGAFGGLLIFMLSPLVMRFANISPSAKELLRFMLRINCFYVMGSAMNTTFICGIFRAGGDTKFGMICDTINMWLYAVPLGMLSAFVFKFPVKVVYVLLCTDEFVKWPWVFKHYFSYSWAKNLTRDSVESGSGS